jgi:hypothetical protein
VADSTAREIAERLQLIAELQQAASQCVFEVQCETWPGAAGLLFSRAAVALSALADAEARVRQEMKQQSRDYTPDELCSQCGVVRPCHAHESVEHYNWLKRKEAWEAAHQTPEVAEVKAWRDWAQFVYLGGGPVTLTDKELRAAVCQAHDDDTEPLKAEVSALSARLAAVEQALRDYGKHKTDCEKLGPAWEYPRHIHDELTCTCGFDVLRKHAEQV